MAAVCGSSPSRSAAGASGYMCPYGALGRGGSGAPRSASLYASNRALSSGAPKCTAMSAPGRGMNRGDARDSGITWSKPERYIGITIGRMRVSRIRRLMPHLKRRVGSGGWLMPPSGNTWIQSPFSSIARACGSAGWKIPPPRTVSIAWPLRANHATALVSRDARVREHDVARGQCPADGVRAAERPPRHRAPHGRLI